MKYIKYFIFIFVPFLSNIKGFFSQKKFSKNKEFEKAPIYKILLYFV